MVCRRSSLAVVLGIALTAGCSRSSSDASAGGGASASAHRYTVRGEVTHVSTAGSARSVTLRHEAVKDFRNESGEVVGMPAMVMPFELAPAVELQGIRAGDKVEVLFAVTWSPPSVKVEELRKLPDDVQLQFGGAPSPSAEKR